MNIKSLFPKLHKLYATLALSLLVLLADLPESKAGVIIQDSEVRVHAWVDADEDPREFFASTDDLPLGGVELDISAGFEDPNYGLQEARARFTNAELIPPVGTQNVTGFMAQGDVTANANNFGQNVRADSTLKLDFLVEETTEFQFTTTLIDPASFFPEYGGVSYRLAGPTGFSTIDSFGDEGFTVELDPGEYEFQAIAEVQSNNTPINFPFDFSGTFSSPAILWANPSTGEFSDENNWAGEVVPGDTDLVAFRAVDSSTEATFFNRDSRSGSANVESGDVRFLFGSHKYELPELVVAAPQGETALLTVLRSGPAIVVDHGVFADEIIVGARGKLVTGDFEDILVGDLDRPLINPKEFVRVEQGRHPASTESGMWPAKARLKAPPNCRSRESDRR